VQNTLFCHPLYLPVCPFVFVHMHNITHSSNLDCPQLWLQPKGLTTLNVTCICSHKLSSFTFTNPLANTPTNTNVMDDPCMDLKQQGTRKCTSCRSNNAQMGPHPKTAGGNWVELLNTHWVDTRLLEHICVTLSLFAICRVCLGNSHFPTTLASKVKMPQASTKIATLCPSARS
jgi:hypothetical protein